MPHGGWVAARGILIEIFPSGGAIGGDDGDAAGECLGDDAAEVFGKSREAEDVTPVPFGFKVGAVFVGDDMKID